MIKLKTVVWCIGLLIPFVLLLPIILWIYGTHDLVRWYFWPRQGCSVAMWKGENQHQYKSLKIDWSHGQTWDNKGNQTTLWHWPQIQWVNVDFDKLSHQTK